MDILFALLISFVILVFSVLQGVFVAFPLLVAMAIVGATLMRRGFSFKSLLQMAIAGSKQSIPVWSVLLLIGAVTAAWLAAGIADSGCGGPGGQVGRGGRVRQSG